MVERGMLTRSRFVKLRALAQRMESSEMSRVEDAQRKHICHRCVRESYLAANIESLGEEAFCDYCHRRAPACGLGPFAECLERAFENHYVRTSPEPDLGQQRLQAGRESEYSWSRKGMPVGESIQEAAGIDEGPANDVAQILEDKHAPADPKDWLGEESDFAATSFYERSRPTFLGLHSSWHEFERELKTKARFFSQSAGALLSKVFGGIDGLSARDGRCLVVDVGPGTEFENLYRARCFQADEGLQDALCQPGARLGSPPSKIARAGRMNAQGISVFYAATMPHVAMAEVRPPVGSRVVVAQFEVTRRLRVLDLNAARDAHASGSIFDPSFILRLHRVDFLRSLGSRMARPVMPDDEGIDYLPTQVVADFLASANDPQLDGIIFPSVQAKDGSNVVLFHRAAKVSDDSIPKDAQIIARVGEDHGEGWEEGYSVDVVMPGNDIDAGKALGLDSDEWWPEQDPREDTLRVVVDSVMVHRVMGVAISTTPHTVHRQVSVRDPSQRLSHRIDPN